jgi:hypothetical protein
MELHAVPAARLVGHGHDRHAVGACGDGEARRHHGHAIAMAHPDIQARRRTGMVLEAVEQGAFGADLDLRSAELAVVAGLDLAAQLHRHRLHAIADAQQRHARVEDGLRCARRAGLDRRFRAAGEDDALRREGRDRGWIVVPGPDLAVDAEFAHPARDQLRVLRAEVEDEDLVAVDVPAGAVHAQDAR